MGKSDKNVCLNHFNENVLQISNNFVFISHHNRAHFQTFSRGIKTVFNMQIILIFFPSKLIYVIEVVILITNI